MGKKRKIPFIALIFLVVLVLAVVVSVLILRESILTAQVPAGLTPGPVLIFESPTPTNGSLREIYPNILPSENSVPVSITIEKQDLDTFLFNWDKSSNAYYDDTLRIAMNFDNDPNIGETSSHFVDISKYGVHGSCSGSSCPQATSGFHDGAMYFDGNDYINLQNCNNLKSSQGTISFWLKNDYASDRYDLFTIEDSSGNYFKVWKNTEDIFLTIGKGGSTVVNALPRFTSLTNDTSTGKFWFDTKWNHFVIAQDGQGVKFYLNGVKVALRGGDGTDWTNHLGTITKCCIGCDDGNGNFQGSIDSLRIFSKAWLNETINCEGYGVDAYPYTETMGPIGGGPGYKHIINPQDADYFVDTKTELLNALSQASSGQIVYVDDNAQIDMGSVTSYNFVKAGVTLASGRGREISPGVYSEGALLYSNIGGSGQKAFFYLQNNARLTGIRFQGACYWDVGNPNNCGKMTGPYVAKVLNAQNVEIDNNDISSFEYSNVAWQLATGWFHHNYVHNNHAYPMVVSAQAHPVAEANIFVLDDAFSGAGNAGCGYTARYNIIDFSDYGWSHHFFDIHGSNELENEAGGGGLLGHWRFNEGAGTETQDVAHKRVFNENNFGYLRNMDANDWVVPSAYKHFHHALDFDGVNDYVEISGNSDPSKPSSGITLEAFIKPTSDPRNKNQMIVIKGTKSSPEYYLYLNAETDTIDFSIGNEMVSWPMPSDLQNQWHHIAGTYNGAQLKIWYEGIVKATKSYSGSVKQGSGQLTIGAEYGGNYAFQGMIDEVMLYAAAREGGGFYTSVPMHAQGHTIIAGDPTVTIAYNTFITDRPRGTLHLGETLIKLRGIPTDRALAYGNKLLSQNRGYNFAQECTVLCGLIPGISGGFEYSGKSKVRFWDYDNCYIPLHSLMRSNFKKIDSDTWEFFFNATQVYNQKYSYYAWAEDAQGNGNYAYGQDDDIIYTSSNPRYVTVKNDVHPKATLLSPGHGTYDEDGQVTLTCNAVDGIYLENITLQVWKDGQSYYKNTVEVGEWENHWDNTKSWQVTLPEGSYTWNCLAYNMGYHGDWADSNYALTVGQGSPDTTPPYFTDIYNVITYDNQSVAVDFDAQDDFAFDRFEVNDSRFSISNTGYLRNVTALSIMRYWLNITIFDTSNNQDSAVIFIDVLDSYIPDTVPPYFTNVANISIYNNQSVAIDFDAEDNAAISSFSVNDSRFSISNTGYLRNVSSLAIMRYWLNITVFDTSNNQDSTIVFVDVMDSYSSPPIPQDSVPPYFTEINDIFIYDNVSVYYDIDAVDNESVVDCFSVNDSRFSIDCDGLLINVSTLGFMRYWLSIVVNDTEGNLNSSIMFVNVSDSTFFEEIPPPAPAPSGNGGGGGGSYTPTTPVGETGVLPPLIEPATEPEQEGPGEEELKGQVKEKEITLPRIEDISWQAWAIIGTSFLFVIYIIFIIAKKPM